MSTDVSAIAPEVPQIDSQVSGNIPAPPPVAELPNPAAAPAAAAVAQTPAPSGSIWKNVLQGALAGLAGSAGSTHFGGGLAKGAAGEINSQIQQHQQQQADLAQASSIHHQSIQDAIASTNLLHLDQQFQNMDQDAQDKHQEAIDKELEFNRQNFGIKYTLLPNTSDAVTAHMQQASLNPAGVSTSGVIVGPHSIAVPDTISPDQNYRMVKTLSSVTGNGLVPQDTFNRWTDQQQAAYTAGLRNTAAGQTKDGTLYKPDELPGAIANLQHGLSAYQAGDNADPNVVKLIQGSIQNMMGQMDSHAKAKTSQAVATANAEMPSKIAVATAEAKAKDAISGARKDNDPVVAYDPAQGNVVTTRAAAEEAGQFHYKADPSKINATVAGMNDVQVKLNQLADIATSPKMAQVQTGLAGALLEAKGFAIGVSGTYVPTGRLNAGLYSENIGKANQATRDFVTATLAAHEAITQLPRLQTFGQSSRMTQQQMEAAQAMLPVPGDDAGMSQQKMDSLQGTIDPLRKQIPKMPGAPLVPSYRERQK